MLCGTRMEPLLPNYQPQPKGGHPRLPMRNVVDGILYVLCTGSSGRRCPASSVRAARSTPTFKNGWSAACSRSCGDWPWRSTTTSQGIDWEWQSVDGAMTKSPLGGEKNREKPDRSRQAGRQAIGAHRRAWRAAGVAVDGANVHDQKAGRGNARQHSGPTPATEAAQAATSLRRQRIRRQGRSPGGQATRYVAHVPRKGRTRLRPRILAAAKLAAGKSNERIPGSTAHGGC